MKKIDINKRYIGQKFGKLTVIKLVEGNNAQNRKYLCKCDCGNKKITSEDNLKRGHCKSCGCLYKNNGGKQKKIKGYYLDSQSKLYKVWVSMIRRCTNPKDCNYERYGRRGITVCEEWKYYSAFRNWAINTGYKESHSRAECSLDRIDNNGNYEPSNCRWTDMKTQSNNTRMNTVVSYNGVQKTLSEWADFYKIPYKLFVNRYIKGWTIEEIITIPKGGKRKYDQY